MRKLAFISAVLILSNLCFAWDIKFIKKIPVEDGVLFNSAGFVVLEDGNFLFTDFKDKENQIKIFNEDGKLIRAWGNMGPGPDEFGGLGFLDYQKPYLAVADAVAAGRMLADPLRAGRVTTRELARVQARRWVPTALIQGVQRGIHASVIARAVGGADNPAAVGGSDNRETAPAPVRMVARIPLLRRIAGYGVAIGPLPEHVPAFARR